MNIRSILFPTDFSPYNEASLKLASSLAAESGARLHIVHVDDMRDLRAVLADSGYPYNLPTEIEDRSEIRERLEQIVPTVPTVEYRHHYVRGLPAQEIVRFAYHSHADLIVMASHGRTGLPRLLMGSVAEEVMRHAPCPVLIVKQPAEAPLPSEGPPQEAPFYVGPI